MLVPLNVSAATFQGEIWDSIGPITDLATADAIVASRSADATFEASTIEFFNSTTLGGFLGTAAATLSGSLSAATPMETLVFRVTGFIDSTGAPQTLRTRTDDGVRLLTNDTPFFERDGTFAATNTEATSTFGADPIAITLLYYQNTGRAEFRFFSDGAIVDAADPPPVPLPAGIVLLPAALAGLVVLRRRPV